MTVVEEHQVFAQAGVADLAAAVADGDVQRIRALAPQSDLGARGDRNVTLLEWAIWNQQPRALAALLDAGADPAQIGMDNETVVHMAAMVEDPKYLGILIEHGAPVDTPATDSGRTPVFNAVRSRRVPQLEQLIAAGADLKRIDATGNSLLHLTGNDGEVAVRLLELGVDPTVRNAQQVTFQHYFFMTPDKILNQQSKDGRQRVRDWLAGRGIPVESD